MTKPSESHVGNVEPGGAFGISNLLDKLRTVEAKLAGMPQDTESHKVVDGLMRELRELLMGVQAMYQEYNRDHRLTMDALIETIAVAYSRIIRKLLLQQVSEERWHDCKLAMQEIHREWSSAQEGSGTLQRFFGFFRTKKETF